MMTDPLRKLAVAALVALALCACKRDAEPTSAPAPALTPATTMAALAASAPPSTSAPPDEARGSRRVVAIDVGEHGFTPSVVDVKLGEPTTLMFTRTSNSTCAFAVVFPDLKIDRDLPLKKAVARHGSRPLIAM